MDTSLIIKASLCTVGTVQMLKSFLKSVKVPGWVYVLITVIVGCAYTLIPMNDRVFACVMVVCGSTMFYDTILHNIEKFFKKEEQ